MTNQTNELTRNELLELLRYLVGDPPYTMDNRYRDLMERFRAMPNPTLTDDPRVNPSTLDAAPAREPTVTSSGGGEPRGDATDQRTNKTTK